MSKADYENDPSVNVPLWDGMITAGNQRLGKIV